ncbi:MAG: MlaD family protein [Ghiorsea sp.]
MSVARDYLQGMQRKVGIFLLLGLAVLLVVLLVSGVKSNFFAKKFYVHIHPPTATAFYEGQPVRFQGFGIGYVNMIDLLEHGKVQITLQLLDKYRVMLHEGAVVQLAKEGMIGEQFVRVSAGDVALPSLQDQMILDYESEASIEQIIEDLKPTIARVDRLLGELGNLVAWVNDPEGDIRLTVANVRELSGGLSSKDLKGMTAEVKGLLRNVRQVVAEVEQEHVIGNLSHALDSTAVTLDEMKPIVQEVSKHSGKALERMNVVLERMQGLVKNLNVVSSDMGELTPELPGLARELRDSVSESRLLMRTIRHSWLLGDDRGGSEDVKVNGMRSLPAVNLRP